MAQDIIPVRFIYRSESMIPLMSVMEHGKYWEKHGIDVRDYRFAKDALDAEEQLLDGGIDFIFGNHVSPYMRLAHGEPIVCLAQSENWLHKWVVTSQEITQLSQLNKKRVVGRPLFLEDGSFCGHGDGNHIVILEQQGVDTRTVEYLLPERVGNAIEAVRDGKADACFISPDRADSAEAAGLRVHRLPPFPMVHSITFTTTSTRMQQEADFAERILKVLVDATHKVRTNKQESMDYMRKPVGRIREGTPERIDEAYDDFVAEYETKPYPRAEAIINVHQLACMVYPEAKTVNPLELWDIGTLRKIHESGYVENLYGGRAALTAQVQRTLDLGMCDNC